MTKTLFQQLLHFFNLLFFIIPLSHAQDFYKWVDASGSTHYTVNPPPNHVKKLGLVSTYQNSNSQSSKYLNDSKLIKIPISHNSQQPQKMSLQQKNGLKLKQKYEKECKITLRRNAPILI